MALCRQSSVPTNCLNFRVCESWEGDLNYFPPYSFSARQPLFQRVFACRFEAKKAWKYVPMSILRPPSFISHFPCEESRRCEGTWQSWLCHLNNDLGFVHITIDSIHDTRRFQHDTRRLSSSALLRWQWSLILFAPRTVQTLSNLFTDEFGNILPRQVIHSSRTEIF